MGYTLSEPYHGNKIIPCFDQPDLKASHKLTLLIDKEWTGIFNEPLTGKSQTVPDAFKEAFPTPGENEIVHTFGTTPKISTYLFVVLAGNFKEIVCPEKHNNIEFRIYVRPSLYQAMLEQSSFVFDITRAGFKHYEDFFGYPYPFSKYDQIFCPEYPSGAMETPGAVTFNDLYVFKDVPSSELRTQCAKVILHELAHMWFGNLVTMKWWNDLWLNESFADFIAFTTLAKLRPPKLEPSELLLFINKVRRAYAADQQPTTHSICAEVQNTEKASLVFDGITYIKGACSLIQLYKLIGHETFSKAMKAYFKTYEWKNATLEDFIKNFKQFVTDDNPESPFSLESWERDWLLKAGLTQIQVEWDPNNTSPNAKLVIRQTSCLNDFPANKFIKAKIAFFDEKGQLLELKDTIINKETTEVEYDGSKKPKIVFPNYQDEGYVKVKIDEFSLKHLKSCIHLVPDETTRAVMWYCFYELIRDGEMNPLDFVDAACAGLETETSDLCIQSILEYLWTTISKYIPSKLRNLVRYKIFEKLYKIIIKTDLSEVNKLLILKRELISNARNEDHVEILRLWLDEKEPQLKAHSLRKIDKWNIVRAIYRSTKYSAEEKLKYYEKVYQEDPSDMGKRIKRYCEAVEVTPEEREALWNSFFDENTKLTYPHIAESMFGFNTERNLDALKKYHEEFYKRIFEVYDKREISYANQFFLYLFPFTDDLEYQLGKVRELLKLTPRGEKAWKKTLSEKEFELTKRIQSYKLLGASLKL